MTQAIVPLESWPSLRGPGCTPRTPDGVFAASTFIQHLERQTQGGRTRAMRRSRLSTPTPLSRIECPDPPTPTPSPPPSPKPMLISAQETTALLQLDRQKVIELERSRQANLDSRQALAHIESRNVAVEQELKKVRAEKAALQKHNQALQDERDQLLKARPDYPVPPSWPAGKYTTLTPYRPRVYAPKSSPLETGLPCREMEPTPSWSHVYRPKGGIHPVEAPPLASDYRPAPRPKPRPEGTGPSYPPVGTPPQPTRYTMPTKPLPVDRISKGATEVRPPWE